MYDTGAFDLFDPAQHAPFIPPLSNLIPSGVCDPHGDRPRIPAGIRMLTNFLRPGGQIENICNGVCDGERAGRDRGRRGDAVRSDCREKLT